MMAAALIWFSALVTVAVFLTRRWWFPEAISEHARLYDQQFQMTLVLTGAIFVLAQVGLGWVLFRYRRRGGRAEANNGNNKMEIAWTAATAVLFLGVLFLGTRIWAGVYLEPPPRDAIPVEVLARQFSWSFRYAGPDGQFGRTKVEYMNDATGNPFGIDDADPAGRDDVVSGALRIPVNETVVLRLRSRDVIHNFFVRELRIKQDVVPGIEIPLTIRAEKTGEYEVPCSELCGLGHHQMRSSMIVLERDEFDRWMRETIEQMKQ